MTGSTLLQALQSEPARLLVTRHPLFDSLARSPRLTSALAHQYRYPVWFFPEFLARAIADASSLEIKVTLSEILWQELGRGDARRAHAVLFDDAVTVAKLGLTPRPPPSASTRLLMEEYASAAGNNVKAVAYVYATELIDLALVQGLGTALEAFAHQVDLPWVQVHSQEEPAHVARACMAVSSMEGQAGQVTDVFVEHVRNLWMCWKAALDEVGEQPGEARK
jgi:hypothetical protein